MEKVSGKREDNAEDRDRLSFAKRIAAGTVTTSRTFLSVQIRTLFEDFLRLRVLAATYTHKLAIPRDTNRSQLFCGGIFLSASLRQMQSLSLPLALNALTGLRPKAPKEKKRILSIVSVEKDLEG
jgi:hypothetical protein